MRLLIPLEQDKCRISLSTSLLWADLPRDLLNRIFVKFGDFHEQPIQDLLTLRLVCKSWRAAITEYSGHSHVTIGKSTDLFGICKLVPTMSRLTVSSPRLDFYLHPVLACSRLISLHLLRDQADDFDPHNFKTSTVDVTVLPSSLLQLDIGNCRLDPANVKHIRCIGLTRLAFAGVNSLPEICQVLDRLPDLKVIPKTVVAVYIGARIFVLGSINS